MLPEELFHAAHIVEQLTICLLHFILHAEVELNKVLDERVVYDQFQVGGLGLQHLANRLLAGFLDAHPYLSALNRAAATCKFLAQFVAP